ncbi:MAG TPA: Holliday junction resolvase RuvX [Microlunatus sp.]|nr:Holliday junction resolvase RuvX [Microlunatus sp.]
MRTGVRVALDWGGARIGVAACDPQGSLAFPIGTVKVTTDLAGTMRAVVELVTEREPIEVIVGLPRSLSGREGPAAAAIRERAVELARAIAPTPVRLVDERLSTVSAARRLGESGRSARQQRPVIDAAAAATILEQALAGERATDQPPGEVVSAGTDPT